jgi:phage-related protein (TIGR01555 family)
MNWRWWEKPEPIPTPVPRIEPKLARPMRISSTAVARLTRPPPTTSHPFELPKYAPGVLPGARVQLAQDEIPLSNVNANFAFAAQWHGTFAEGVQFMGYPYLSELAQRQEYRVASELIAEEMTRKFIVLKATGKTDKTEKIKELTADIKKFRLREAFQQALILDGLMGLCPINIDVGTNDDPAEMATPLLIDKAKIGKGTLRGFKAIDPIWIAPTNYNASNALDPTFYKPQTWFIMGMRVHVSRLLMIISRPVPDLLKPAYNFGGLSLSQILKPYVDNWLQTRQSVAADIKAFTTWVLKTNIMASLMPAGVNGEPGVGDGGNAIDDRLAVFSGMLNNRGVLAVDKEQEDFANIAFSLATLDALQAQSQEHMAAVVRAPLIKYFGITPTGLNASTDGEVRSFYDEVKAYQVKVCDVPLKTSLDIIQLNRFGEIDPEIEHEWTPLYELDEAGRAAVQKTKADTDAVLSQEGAIGPDDIRKRVANDPESNYHGLEGDAPGVPEPAQDPSLADPAEKIENQGAEGSETEANSGT